MIDLHCHLIPGIDDGPAALEDSLAMARRAAADGITHARTTPHIHVGRYDNDLAGIAAAAQALQAAIAAEGIGLELSFAAEVRLDYEILPMIEAGRIPFLGSLDGYRVLLLEFPHDRVPVGAEEFVLWLLARKIRPMIAHPERNRDVLRDLARIEPFVRMGCLLQVTADAVSGGFGSRCEARAAELLERGWVAVLASDGHDTGSRPPRMSAGRDAAARLVGAAAARRLTVETPQRILDGR
jgi:protein-tyrosine phosphatase